MAHVIAQADTPARRRIIRAASEEFARHGYAGARIRSIVDAAGVNLAAINYYFGGKRGLYLATIGHLAERALASFPSGKRERRGQTPARRLHRLVYEFLEALSAGPAPLGRILAHEAMDPSPRVDHVLEEMSRPQMARLRAVVRELAGRAASENDVTFAALAVAGQCLLHMFGRAAVERLFPGVTAGADARRKVARQITDFSLAGILRLRPLGERRKGWRAH